MNMTIWGVAIYLGASPRAELSAQAFLDGVRRLMAIHEIVESKEKL